MFQTFTATTNPNDGPPRLAALRAEITAQALDGFLVPRADAHQGEYVAPRDERLAWLTGFTGSAGFAAVLMDRAGVFIDGRYRVQVKAQVAPEFTPVPWPETSLTDWLIDALPGGGTIGFDPWLHSAQQITDLRDTLTPKGITLTATTNLIDRIWPDQPDRPANPVTTFPTELAGKGDETKRADIAQTLRDAGQTATILTLPDSICWLLNIRGTDIPRNPVTHAFAILHANGHIDLFSTPAKFDALGPDPAITLHDWSAFDAHLTTLTGPIRVDPNTLPHAVAQILSDAQIKTTHAPDPCLLPKACKTEAEIAATRTAHLRDAAAMARFLAWLDAEAPKGALTEIDVVKQLESFRRDTNALRDISFETICGAGPNGAIVHYRVTEDTNRPLGTDTLLLVDSGGQYLDGTTDITRTIAIGTPPEDTKQAFTRVLQGMIAIHRARFPQGVTGAHLDALARAPLWANHMDFDHGTGHGVGVFLSVHEGPQRIARTGTTPLQQGMILSNEPGYYREGAFGIRLENLIVVQPAQPTPTGDQHRKMLGFETLTWAPIDRRLILPDMLAPAERDWLNAYHAETYTRIAPSLDPATAQWLKQATGPL